MVISSTKMITYYGRIGELQKAVKLFQEMPHRNQISYNAMITLFVDSGQLDAASRLFAEMPERNSTSYTLMISGFSKSGLVVEAREVFDSVPSLYQNVISWTAMISCYVQNHQSLHALKLFTSSYGDFFALRIIPNSYTFSILLKSCADVQSIATAAQIHALIVKLLDEEIEEVVFVQNALIDLHSKFGRLTDAEKIFNRLTSKDLSSWNTMMTSYTRHSLIDEALRVFNSMKEKDTLSWNIVFSGLAESGRGEEAINLFICLLRSWPETKPNPSTYTIILTICSTLTALEMGRQIHTCTIKISLNRSNVFTGNSLITMYSRCGSVKELERVFDDMVMKDIISWNSLLLGLGQNGNAKKTLEVAEEALKLGSFNNNTFIAILTACSHGGLVNEGMEYFRSMSSKYGIGPDLDHYICVIDMLGRAGRISDAQDVLQGMPFKANSVAWAALLSACLVHGNGEVGEIAAQELQNLEPGDVTSYVMLANIYGKIGRSEDSRKVLNLMREKGLRKDSGFSWIIEI
ncbi:pentatricopeptide repeat-containing protein At4g02750-like [Magnolia sinica]|uniref:pentatricopeptide repeat-containing protein At4g02750-like n=1 Tax=Magnolia sinica TaxID=86752 RepID=UPI0026588F92|nr:pentatricopeptide repeat-containing protein At4g02750-like [Magnolia sinica]